MGWPTSVHCLCTMVASICFGALQKHTAKRHCLGVLQSTRSATLTCQPKLGTYRATLSLRGRWSLESHETAGRCLTGEFLIGNCSCFVQFHCSSTYCCPFSLTFFSCLYQYCTLLRLIPCTKYAADFVLPPYGVSFGDLPAANPSHACSHHRFVCSTAVV